MQWQFRVNSLSVVCRTEKYLEIHRLDLVQCIRDKLWLGHGEAALCFAFLWHWGVRQLHSLGNSSCYPGRNLSGRGTTPSDILQLGRVSSKYSLVAAGNAPFVGPCGLQSSPSLFSEVAWVVWARHTGVYYWLNHCLNIALTLYSYGLGICDLIHIRLHSTPRVPVYVQWEWHHAWLREPYTILF